MRNYQDSKSKEKIALFLRGGPGVGKSTLAPILAKKISFSAKIEQDVLRYMIVGGLVATKDGLQPSVAPEEYYKQCRLGDRNVFALVRNFTEEGYLCIVAGLNGGESAETFYLLDHPEEVHWYPNQQYLEKELPNITTFQIVLDAKIEILSERLKKRGFSDNVIDFIKSQREIFLNSLSGAPVDLILDTGHCSPNQLAKRIIEKFSLT